VQQQTNLTEECSAGLRQYFRDDCCCDIALIEGQNGKAREETQTADAPERANRRRKLALWPDFDNQPKKVQR
jgi:hypothetical protein